MLRNTFSHRIPVALWAGLGLAVSAYLALFQFQLIGNVWDPLFGARSSAWVLSSHLSGLFPLPDAAMGALAYLVETIAVLAGGADRFRTAPRIVYIYSGVAFLMTGVGLLLFGYQLLVLRELCTFCLISALISVGLFFPAIREFRAARAAESEGRGAREIRTDTGARPTRRAA